MSEHLSKYKEDFVLLLEAGFIAVNHADEDSAIKLFKSAELLNPENVLPQIGLGYMHLCKLELRQAINIFQAVLKKEPNNEMAQAFLGITLSFTPDQLTKGESILETTAKDSQDPEIKKLANLAVDFVDTFIKKQPSPYEVGSNKKK